MHRKDGQTDEIYENDDAIKGKTGKETTDSTQRKPSELTGSDSVRNRSSRAAAVCLGLLCVLLLTAVIVLCVHIYTKSTNYTEERDQLIFKNKDLTNERDQLRNYFQSYDGWTYYKSIFYYMSNETKNWTESRRDCTERGADLIIINNREEQDFVKNMAGSAAVWIGLTDIDVEGTWKWVDNSTLMTSGFWGISSGFQTEPNGGTRENCALTADHNQRWPTLSGWLDSTCNSVFQWICEKSISQLTMP